MATLREVVTGKGWDASEAIITEVEQQVPELRYFPVRTIEGTTFQSMFHISDPTTGWRTVGNGVDASDEGYELRTYKLAILAGLCKRDKAAVYADVRGKEECLNAAGKAHVRSAMKTLAKSIYYGDTLGTHQFQGAAALANAKMVVDAGASAAASGDTGLTSVYAFGATPDCEGCAINFNKDSAMITAKELEWVSGEMTGANSKPVPAWVTDLTGWAGFSFAKKYSAGRIANLTADTSAVGAKTLTDALLAKLVGCFRKNNDGALPTVIFAPFDQLEALRVSRSAVIYNTPGDKREHMAAFPTDFDGIPLIGTSAIDNGNEAAYSAA